MTALPPEVRRAAEPVGVGGFEIGYVTDDGLEHRVSLSQAWATPFESCSPDTPVHLTHRAAASERAVVGLSSAEASARLIRYGPNSLRTHRVLALLATTAVVSFFLGDRTQAIIIGVILVASIGLGFVNEYRAERASAVDKSRQEHPLRAP